MGYHRYKGKGMSDSQSRAHHSKTGRHDVKDSSGEQSVGYSRFLKTGKAGGGQVAATGKTGGGQVAATGKTGGGQVASSGMYGSPYQRGQMVDIWIPGASFDKLLSSGEVVSGSHAGYTYRHEMGTGSADAREMFHINKFRAGLKSKYGGIRDPNIGDWARPSGEPEPTWSDKEGWVPAPTPGSGGGLVDWWSDIVGAAVPAGGPAGVLGDVKGISKWAALGLGGIALILLLKK